MSHKNKKTTSEKWNFGSNKKLVLKRTMNGLGKPFRKNCDPKNRKNRKNPSEIAACEQKTTSEKANFCSNTVFSLYFKIRANKIFPATKPLAFSLHFLFRRDQNQYSNLTSKIIKCGNKSKKHSRKNSGRRKLPILLTKRLEQLMWTLNLLKCKCHKKLRTNRNGIQKQIEQKKLELKFF